MARQLVMYQAVPSLCRQMATLLQLGLAPTMETEPIPVIRGSTAGRAQCGNSWALTSMVKLQVTNQVIPSHCLQMAKLLQLDLVSATETEPIPVASAFSTGQVQCGSSRVWALMVKLPVTCQAGSSHCLQMAKPLQLGLVSMTETELILVTRGSTIGRVQCGSSWVLTSMVKLRATS